MSSNHNYIVQLCRQLADKGITPTVGMIRSKSNRPLSMPEVIQVLRQWKEDKDSLTTIAEDESPAAQSQTIEQRLVSLEKQVEELQQLLIKHNIR